MLAERVWLRGTGLFLLWRFRLFQRHRHRRLIVEDVAGTPILVLPDVFNPKLFHTGEALARSLAETVRPGMAVLDMGAGSGIGAVFAARLGATVTAVDINPEAVRCTRLNALLNQMERQVEALHGDLFEPVVGQRFDLVLFNPPFFSGRPGELWEYAWRSENVLDRFGRELASALLPGGRALVILSSRVAGARETLEECGLVCRTVWQRRLLNEHLRIVELVPRRAES